MSWERYLEALKGNIDFAKNMSFQLHHYGIMTYTQDKFGLSAYYDKRIVAPMGYLPRDKSRDFGLGHMTFWHKILAHTLRKTSG